MDNLGLRKQNFWHSTSTSTITILVPVQLVSLTIHWLLALTYIYIYIKSRGTHHLCEGWNIKNMKEFPGEIWFMVAAPDLRVLSKFSLMTGYPLRIQIDDPKSHLWVETLKDVVGSPTICGFLAGASVGGLQDGMGEGLLWDAEDAVTMGQNHSKPMVFHRFSIYDMKNEHSPEIPIWKARYQAIKAICLSKRTG